MDASYRHRLISTFGLGITEREFDDFLAAVAETGKALLVRANGPVPLFEFSQKLSRAVGMRPPPRLDLLSDSVKTLLWALNDPHLRLRAPSDMPGVGYVFDELKPEMRPIVGRSF